MSRIANEAIPETTREEIGRLERIASASWPALEETSLEGWVLGSSGAYTRRANCVSPFASPATSATSATFASLGTPADTVTPVARLAARVAEVEAHYAARGRSAVFKMTAAALPEELDAFLQARGYGRHSETVVMILPDLTESSLIREAGDAGAGRFEFFETRPSDAWLSASCVFSQVLGERRSDYEAILEHLSVEECACSYGAWTVGGFIRSVALAVRCEGITSFHQVATDPEARGRRYADCVLRGLLRAASREGAASAMLSVEAENASARRLYDRLGFREVYRYWYRER